MRYPMTAIAGICALSVAALPTWAAGPGQQGQTANQPSQSGSGFFPPNEPMPMYRTGANNPNASLQNPGSPAPNAGNTGPTGSAGTGHGWTPPADYGKMQPAPQR